MTDYTAFTAWVALLVPPAINLYRTPTAYIPVYGML